MMAPAVLSLFQAEQTCREEDWLCALLFEPERARALLRADSGEEARGAACDWAALVERAGQEGVSAVLYHRLKEQRLESLVPQPLFASLSEIYHANLRRNLLIVGGLRRVLEALQAAGIPCIALKGVALAERIYPNVALRGMGDVDLLIRKEDFLEADGVLASIDFFPQDGIAAQALRNPAGYLASLEYRPAPSSPWTLHLHWHPVNTSVPATVFIGGIDLDRIWERSETVDIADSRARVLSPEHLILYLCEHALRAGHSFDRLILICDLFFAIKAHEGRFAWDGLVEESRRIGLSRFAYHGLTIVHHVTGLPIPGACLAQLAPPDLTRGERLFLRLQFSGRRIRGSSCLIYLALNRGLPAKIGFIARTLFPPRPILLQRRQAQQDDSSTSSGPAYRARVREVLGHLLHAATRLVRRRIVL